MKCITIFLFSAGVLCAADFTTGQAARLVIGQPTFTSQDSNSSDTILGAASGLAFAADTLFVADSNRVGASPSNHRVLLFQNVSGMLPRPTDQLIYNSKCPVCVGHATVVLGQPDFTTATENLAATPTTLRLPTAVASDGVHVVVADTNHNRVLIWNRIPTSNNTPADVVVGQQSFTTTTVPGNTPSAKSMRGPQGVWIQNGRLYVADTQNNRVLIFNRIPTSNGAAADVVLGQPNFTTFVEPDLTQQKNNVSATQLLNPVAVSSDGLHLLVTDLGYNRVLIWNSIPTSNGAAADVAIGQPDLVSSVANNGFSTDPNDTTQKQTPVLCKVSNGTDTNSNPTYPSSCNATVSFPRFALTAGNRLFIADGGNDRVLMFNSIPTQSGASADAVIGQIGGSVNQASDAADSLRTPMSLAWDGTNLYVSDAYNRRITVYSIGQNTVPYAGVVNSASLNIVARDRVTITGGIQAGDAININVGGTQSTDSAGKVTTTGGADYKYTIVKDDTISTIVNALTNLINAANSGAGDTNVYATPDLATGDVILTSRVAGTAGNSITVYVTVTVASGSTIAQIVATAGSSTLSGGGDAAQIAPGSIVSVTGTNLSYHTASADPKQNPLPNILGGTQVYFNGIAAPLVMVSPTRVNAQIPWELGDTTSISAFVRSQNDDGSVVVTTPVAVSIVTANPGIYAQPGTNPSVGIIYHASSAATGIVSVDGTATAGDTATVAIEDRSYTYKVQSGDTVTGIRDALVNLINQDPKVTAIASGEFQRIILQARVQGPEGNGIVYTASASSSATVIMTAIGTNLCCAAVANSPITPQNPAVPGELIYVYATGLGVPVLTDGNKDLISDRLPVSDQRTGNDSRKLRELHRRRQNGGCDLRHASARVRGIVPGAVAPESGPSDRSLLAAHHRAGYLREQHRYPADRERWRSGSSCGGSGGPAYRQWNRSLRPGLIHHRTAAGERFQSVCQRRGSGGRQRPRAGQYRLVLRRQPGAKDRRFRGFGAIAIFARRREYDDWRRTGTVVLCLPDAVQFPNPAVYAQRSGVHHSVDSPGNLNQHGHGATEALFAGTVHHEPGRHGSGRNPDRGHRFAGGAERRILQLASCEGRRIHLDLRHRTGRRFEPARRRRRESHEPAVVHRRHTGSHDRRSSGPRDFLRPGSRFCRPLPDQREGSGRRAHRRGSPDRAEDWRSAFQRRDHRRRSRSIRVRTEDSARFLCRVDFTYPLGHAFRHQVFPGLAVRDS